MPVFYSVMFVSEVIVGQGEEPQSWGKGGELSVVIVGQEGKPRPGELLEVIVPQSWG